MAEDKKIFGNVVRVATKEIYRYAYAILLAMSPDIYEKYGEIKIQVTLNNLMNADYLVKIFNPMLQEVKREKKTIEEINPFTGQSTELPDAFEITLKKHPALRHS